MAKSQEEWGLDPRGTLMLANTEPRQRKFNGELVKDAEGLPLWVVEVEEKTSTRKQLHELQVASEVNPVASLKLDQPIKLVNFRHVSGVGSSGAWFKFVADEVKAA